MRAPDSQSGARPAHHGVLKTGVALLEKSFAPQVLAQKVRQVLNAR
jgi:hypothetical protein